MLGEFGVRRSSRCCWRRGRPPSKNGKSGSASSSWVCQDRPIDDAIRATDEQIAEDRVDVDSDQAITENALGLLATPSRTPYSSALAELRDDTRTWWEEQRTRELDDYEEDQTPYHADAKSLRRFLES
jgi:hypothetical protein